VACHPGFTATEMKRHIDTSMLKGLTLIETWQGCLPTLMAATTTVVE
jgi:hypothetical protein